MRFIKDLINIWTSVSQKPRGKGHVGFNVPTMKVEQASKCPLEGRVYPLVPVIF
jgi:hypothetical protein